MPYVQIAGSPLAPARRPIEVFYREHGRDLGAGVAGSPLLILHGAWGYEFYPFDAQIAALPELRFLIPDRTGYGRSPRITALPPGFHRGAAEEHEAFLDALGVERCAIWGHSDGAVIAAIMALRRPARITGIILEALHVDRVKPRSREFFTMMADDPDGFGTRVAGILAAEHGADYWRTIVGASGRAWLDIAATPDEDFYDHRLGELSVPALVLHGTDDPRTEPDELDRIARALPAATIHRIAGGGHSPHSKRSARDEATRVAARFLRAL
ncbi:MAG TPA: alpha/beta fold hydrolase [Kofleriaceae bacterium]|nr:alpha/beta fold hydrolase [Kofleriaceae bacterium]